MDNSHSTIRLISTDFDYTLVNPDQTDYFERRLIETIQHLQSKGVIWALNTGRTPSWLQDGIRAMRFPILPDYTLTTERTVHRVNVHGPTPFHEDSKWHWEDVGEWNAQSIQHLEVMYAASKPLVDKFLVFLESETKSSPIFESIATIIPEPTEYLTGVLAHSEQEADLIEHYIRTKMQPLLPELGYQRNTVYLRLCHIHYHKGAALGELTRVLGLTADQVFAVGDQYNDISMLDGKYAKHVACPGNSIEPVKTLVASQEHGYVAQNICGGGVVEALERLCSLGFL